MLDKKEILEVVSEGYYLNPKMIKFLLVENLALKTMLHEKGLLDPEEYQVCQNKAAEILEQKAQSEILAYAKKSLS